jgi:hypothetical protein
VLPRDFIGVIVATHVELYRALQPHVGEDAAQMIADVVPPAANLATKEDVQALRADLFKWGLSAVIPIWVGVWGSLVVLILDALQT